VDFPVTDVLQMMGRAGRPQFDDHAVAVIMAHEPKKNFYKKFLHEPFPVESSLHNFLHDHVNAEIAGGVICNLENCLEFITWTYFFRRLIYNPSYYQLEDSSEAGIQIYLITMLSKVCVELWMHECIYINEEGYDSASKSSGLITSASSNTSTSSTGAGKDGTDKAIVTTVLTSLKDTNFMVSPTPQGRITSYYYLYYKTVAMFRVKVIALNREYKQKQLSYSTDLSSGKNTNETKEATSSSFSTHEWLISSLMFLLCQAYEFSELPVRHNEDLLNMQLAQVSYLSLLSLSSPSFFVYSWNDLS
jgi:replicative superfamily II helicase